VGSSTCPDRRPVGITQRGDGGQWRSRGPGPTSTSPHRRAPRTPDGACPPLMMSRARLVADGGAYEHHLERVRARAGLGSVISIPRVFEQTRLAARHPADRVPSCRRRGSGRACPQRSYVASPD
jgi:hypothetical protein